MRYDAVIFDMDGTLVDSERIWAEAGPPALARIGHPGADAALMDQITGLDEPSMVRLFEAALGTGPIDAAALTEAWGDEIDRIVARDGMPLKPGVHALLDRLDALGLPRAVATSTSSPRAEITLEQAGIADRIDVVVTASKVSRPKPDPEPYLTAARLLGADPARCLAFEDSEVGAEAAQRAGMTVVQVPDLHGTDGRWARLVAPDLLSGARAAGLGDD